MLSVIFGREGFHVTSCESVAVAKQLLSAQAFGVAVVDLRFPTEDGLELLREWAYRRLARTRFIIFTGNSTLQSAKEALNLGAYAYVEKSTDLTELITRVHGAATAYLNDFLGEAEKELQFQVGLLDAVQQSVIATDLAGQVTYWNKHATIMFGWTAEEALGRNIIDLVVPLSEMEYGGQLLERLRGGEALSGEFLVRNRDNRCFPIQVTNSPIYDSAGQLTGIVGISRDIAEQRRASETQRFKQFAIDRARESIFWLTSDARLIDVNEAACRELGYTREELLAMTVHDIDPSVPKEGWARTWRRLRAAKTLLLQSQHRHKDGHLIPVEVSTNFIEYEGREYNCSIVRDITERKAIEDELRFSQQRLAEAQRIAHIGNWEWDLKTNKTSWSEELYRMCQVSPDSFAPSLEALLELIVPEDRHLLRDHVRGILESEESFAVEYRMRAGHRVYYHSCHAQLIRCENGAPFRLIGIVQDVTKQRESQLQLRRAERLASLGTLAAGIAHEINNPMSAAWTAAEAAKLIKHNRDASDMLDECLDTIGNAVQRCQLIIENMLRFAWQQASQKTPHDVNLIIRQAVETTQLYARYHGATIRLELTPDLPPALVNASEIEQVLVNLIRNALKAGGGTSVSVGSELGVQVVRLRVRDNGCGIADEHIGQIFDPFFTTSNNAEGTGLGLAISHAIIEDHDGRIDVDSTPGRGTTFIVTLPISG